MKWGSFKSFFITLKLFPYSTGRVFLVTVVFCLCSPSLCRSSALNTVIFSATIQRHYVPSYKVPCVFRKQNSYRICICTFGRACFSLGFLPIHVLHVGYVESFNTKFSTDTNGLKFFVIKTSAILYTSREFALFYPSFLKMSLLTSALQASWTETFLPALFGNASLWRPASHGFSGGRSIPFPF